MYLMMKCHSELGGSPHCGVVEQIKGCAYTSSERARFSVLACSNCSRSIALLLYPAFLSKGVIEKNSYYAGNLQTPERSTVLYHNE